MMSLNIKVGVLSRLSTLSGTEHEHEEDLPCCVGAEHFSGDEKTQILTTPPTTHYRTRRIQTKQRNSLNYSMNFSYSNMWSL